MKELKYNVQAFWDAEAAVWVATSEDVSGLVTEADTLEKLNEKLRQIIPELLIVNGIIEDNFQGVIMIKLMSHRQEIIALAF